jgi:hypothetical protein
MVAPLAVTALFFWLVIPVFALFFGALPYLIFGTPLLMWMVTRFPMRAANFAIGGLAAQAVFVGAFWVKAVLQPDELAGMLNFMALWGVPFAVAWFVTFALLYRRLYRPVNPAPMGQCSERNA